MASVIPTLTPASRGQHDGRRAQRTSLLQLDNAGALLACSGPLFEATAANHTGRNEILTGWKTKLGDEISFESLIEQSRSEISPLTISATTYPRDQNNDYEISILPQFSSSDSSVDGISIIFKPKEPEPELAPIEIDFELASTALQSSDQAFWFWKPEPTNFTNTVSFRRSLDLALARH